jgi:hypothetical protein
MIDEIRSKVSTIIRDRVTHYASRVIKSDEERNLITELTKLHYDIDGVFAEAIITKYQTGVRDDDHSR